MRNALGVFGLGAGAIVVALVSRYGYATSDTPLDGAIAAFFFAVIAIGGIGGPAVAVHLFRVAERWAKAWGAVAGSIALIALAANLSNSLGAIAGRADKTLAERKSATDGRKDAREALTRLTVQRAALEKFSPATEDDVAAARAVVTSAERSTLAECGDGSNSKLRGPRCLNREVEERTARETLKGALANKGLADQARALDANIAAERRKLEGAPSVASANPMADALARLFHVGAEDAATWQQMATVVVVELLIAFALIAWELLVSTPGTVPATSRSDGAAAFATGALDQTGKARTDTVGRFMLACLSRTVGERAAGGAIYLRYQQWCKEQTPNQTALPPREFGAEFASRCKRIGVRTQRDGDKVWCLDVRLAS